MTVQLVILDLFGLVLVLLGFTMAFRQRFVRRLLGWSPAPHKSDAADPATYGLRIAGVMIMVFGFALAMMFTLFNFS